MKYRCPWCACKIKGLSFEDLQGSAVVSYVSDYRALMSGFSWWGDKPASRSAVITYSFEAGLFDYVKTSPYSDEFREILQASDRRAEGGDARLIEDDRQCIRASVRGSRRRAG